MDETPKTEIVTFTEGKEEPKKPTLLEQFHLPKNEVIVEKKIPPKSGPCVDCRKQTRSHKVGEGIFRCHVCHELREHPPELIDDAPMTKPSSS